MVLLAGLAREKLEIFYVPLKDEVSRREQGGFRLLNNRTHNL